MRVDRPAEAPVRARALYIALRARHDARMSFAEETRAAIALLGATERDPVVDFILDPGRARRALADVPEGHGLVIRAQPEHGAAGEGYGPKPVDPLWIRVMRGAREIGTAEQRGGDGMVRKAVRIELDERTERCCDAPACKHTRAHAGVWMVLEGTAKGAKEERLLIAEERVNEGAPTGARSIAAGLAEAMDLPPPRENEAEAEAAEPPPALGEALDAALLARFSLRTEGDRLVVRDWDSRGPRATAARNTWIGGAIMAVAALCVVALAEALRTGSQGSAIGAGAAAALLGLTGYTFISVARFSAKYHARSAPLVWIGRDRLVVMPWVGRDGAVDARPEGRFGAAVPLADVSGARVTTSAGAIAVRIETDHGPFDAVICPDRAVADLLCAVIERAMDDARHPRANATARQRFRARAAAAA